MLKSLFQTISIALCAFGMAILGAKDEIILHGWEEWPSINQRGWGLIVMLTITFLFTVWSFISNLKKVDLSFTLTPYFLPFDIYLEDQLLTIPIVNNGNFPAKNVRFHKEFYFLKNDESIEFIEQSDSVLKNINGEKMLSHRLPLSQVHLTKTFIDPYNSLILFVKIKFESDGQQESEESLFYWNNSTHVKFGFVEDKRIYDKIMNQIRYRNGS